MSKNRLKISVDKGMKSVLSCGVRILAFFCFVAIHAFVR